MRYKLFFIILLSIFSQAFSQTEEMPIAIDTVGINDHQQLIATDSLLTNNFTTDNILAKKSLDPQFRKKYQSPDYNYDLVKPKISLWEKMMKKIAQLLSKIFGNLDPVSATKYTGNIMRIIGIVILGVVLFFLINFLLGKEGNFIFGKKNKKIKIEDSDIIENIHEINFSERISFYENQGQYRHAIRYQFLHLLKQLSDKKLIDWNPEKTNKDYIKEITNLQQKNHLKNGAYIYDYVWYGEFHLDKDYYNQLKNQFKD